MKVGSGNSPAVAMKQRYPLKGVESGRKRMYVGLTCKGHKPAASPLTSNTGSAPWFPVQFSSATCARCASFPVLMGSARPVHLPRQLMKNLATGVLAPDISSSVVTMPGLRLWMPTLRMLACGQGANRRGRPTERTAAGGRRSAAGNL